MDQESLTVVDEFEAEGTEDEEAEENEPSVQMKVPRRIPVELASEEFGVADEEKSADLVEEKTLEQVTDINLEGEESIGGPPVRKSSAQASLDDVAEIPVELEVELIQPEELELQEGDGSLITIPIQEVPYRPEVIEIPIAELPPEPALIEIPITEIEAEPTAPSEPTEAEPKLKEISEATLTDQTKQIQVRPPGSTEIPVEEVVPHFPKVLEIPIETAPGAEEEQPIILEATLVEEVKRVEISAVTEGKEIETKVAERKLVAPEAEHKKELIEVPIEQVHEIEEEKITEPVEEEKVVEVKQISVSEAKPAELEEPAAVAETENPVEVEEELEVKRAEKPADLEKQVEFREILTEEAAAPARKREYVTEEPTEPAQVQPKRKSRGELIEEVRRDLQLQWDAHGTLSRAEPLPQAAQPSHVTFSSRAPPRFHAPFFKPFSVQADPEPHLRTDHTIGYIYIPPKMDHLREFDDIVKVGPLSMGLWSTSRALARSKSMERRRPWMMGEGYGPAPLRSALPIQSSHTRSVPVSRSSSHTNLMDYVNATRSELRRSRSRSKIDEYTGEHYYRSEQPVVSSELLNEPPVFEKIACRTQNYISAIHKPYESNVPSYYGTYLGKPPYSPYVVAAHYDHLYPRDSYAKRRLNRWMEDTGLPHGIRSIYESYLSDVEKDLCKERDRRSRLEREAFYADRELDFARKSMVQAKNAYSALEFERFMSDTERLRPQYTRSTYATRPPVHIRRYFYPYA